MVDVEPLWCSCIGPVTTWIRQDRFHHLLLCLWKLFYHVSLLQEHNTLLSHWYGDTLCLLLFTTYLTQKSELPISWLPPGLYGLVSTLMFHHWTCSYVQCQCAKIQWHSTGPIPTPCTHFDVIHDDLLGPLPPSQGFNYLLTCVDCFPSAGGRKLSPSLLSPQKLYSSSFPRWLDLLQAACAQWLNLPLKSF